MGRKRPLCYPELSVSVCMSVLTQSKSICHQDCHCGTKREGSLPGRTHSERNGERQDRHKEAGQSLGEVQVGSGNLRRPTYSYNSKHTCRDQEDWTSNSLINTFFFKIQICLLVRYYCPYKAVLVNICLSLKSRQNPEVTVDEKIKSSPQLEGCSVR